MCHTYILFSQSLNKYYVGSTIHLLERIEEHNRGKSSFTKSVIPWELMYAIECDEISQARELEIKIKKRGAVRYLESLRMNISELK